MPIPSDYHVHTHFSCDCQTPMEDMCRAALEKGLEEVGITEHFDLNPEDPCYRFFKAEEWWEELERCREVFGGSLIIRAGVELGEPHIHRKESHALLKAFDWDYSLGSLHWVDGIMIFDEAYFEQPASDAYGGYFCELLNLVQDGEFEILAHMDAVKRYGFDHFGAYDPLAFEAQIRAVLRACASTGKAIEINTSTLRRPIREPSPSSTIAGWFLEEGGKWITLGSDAHLPEHVGFGQQEMMRLMDSIHLDQLARFVRRQPEPLDVRGL
jgi:histidinol-phosphatase (PHP family)